MTSFLMKQPCKMLDAQAHDYEQWTPPNLFDLRLFDKLQPQSIPMRLTSLTLLVLLFVWISSSLAIACISDDIDQQETIIDQHIAAHGGMEKLSSIHSMKLTGDFTSFSVVHDFETIKTSDGWFYSSYNLGKHRVTEGYDGNVFWTVDPWQGFDFPRKINQTEKHVIMQKADIVTPFFMWKEKSYEVRFLGREHVDGMEMYVLELTRPGMPAETWYLNANTFLAYKYNSQWVDFTYPMQAESFFDDYREVGGIVLPFYMEQTFSTRHRITQIEQVLINSNLDDHIFEMPPCEFMDKISLLDGTWDVGVQLMTRQGNWHEAGNVHSTFRFIDRNRIQGNISYDMVFPASNDYIFSYNKRSSNYQLIQFNELFSTTDLFHGTIADNTLILDNLPEEEMANSQAEQGNQRAYTRYIISLVTNEVITIERKQSNDRGETWRDAEKLTLTRH